MSIQLFTGFKGIDQRRKTIAADQLACYSALNLELTPGGGYKTRPMLKLVSELHEQSVGLFAINGKLSAVVPAGSKAYKNFEPINVTYFPIGESEEEDFPDDEIEEVLSADTFGADAYGGGLPYLSIRMASGVTKHFWLNQTGLSNGAKVNNLVQLGFQTVGGALKMVGRMWASNPVTGEIMHSAALKPDDWTTVGDAGSINVGNYAKGENAAIGMVEFNDALFAFFPNSVQLWQVSPVSPAEHQYVRTYYGPGTRAYRSIHKVHRDVFFFSDGGFRSLTTALTFGEQEQEEIGAPIEALTKRENVLFQPSGYGFNPSGFVLPPDGKALWVQRRSQYLCAFNRLDTDGSRIYVRTLDRMHGVNGWTVWELPMQIDAMCELNGAVYIRSGTNVFVFDDEITYEDVGERQPIAWEIRTHFFPGSNPMRNKDWLHIDLIADGACQIHWMPNPTNDEEIYAGPYLDGTTVFDGLIDIGMHGPALAMKIAGSGIFSLDSYSIEYRQNGGMR